MPAPRHPEGPSKGAYLALETSGPLGSVAVGRSGKVLARALLERQGRHATEVIPRVAEVLAAAGLPVRDLAGIVVGAGPGSFTGVRVAAATAKGLAHALEIPLWAFSSLAAAAIAERIAPPPSGAASHVPWDGFRYVLFDARGDRVYAACYEVQEECIAGIVERVPPHATRIQDLLEKEIPTGAWFAGDGAVRHEAAIRGAGYQVLPAPAGLPRADGLIHLLALPPGRAPEHDPARWEPAYLKASSAERARVG